MAEAAVTAAVDVEAEAVVAAEEETDCMSLSNGRAADRVGIGWRPELAAGIYANLDRIDIIEVIADDYFGLSKGNRKLEFLRSLAAQRPVTLHGVELGPASTSPIEAKRIEAFARLRDAVKPESWSEHLALVRAGGVEIGHLAAAPRNAESVEGTLANLHRMERTMGSAPIMENISSLIDPPLSTMSESTWMTQVLNGSNSGMLLDLHNVHVNAHNFGFDPYGYLDEIPLERVRGIHIAGGRPIEGRILDDHLHDVPDPVYDLLRYVAARAEQSLTVVLERDGKYPSMNELMAQLKRARRAIADGRALARAGQAVSR